MLSFLLGISNTFLSIIPTVLLSHMEQMEYATWFILLSLLPLINLVELGVSQYVYSAGKNSLKYIFYSYSIVILILFLIVSILLIFIYNNLDSLMLFFFLVGSLFRIYLNIIFSMMIASNDGQLERKYKFFMNLCFLIPLFILFINDVLYLKFVVSVWLFSSFFILIHLSIKYVNFKFIQINTSRIKQYINITQSYHITLSSLTGILIFNFPLYYFNFDGINENMNNLIIYGIFIQIMNFVLQFSQIICSYQCHTIKNLKDKLKLNNYVILNIYFLLLISLGSKLFLALLIKFLFNIEITNNVLLLITIMLIVEIYQVSFARVLIVNGFNNFIKYNILSSAMVVFFNLYFNLNFEEIIFILLISQLSCLFFPILINIKLNFNIDILYYVLILLFLIIFNIFIFNLQISKISVIFFTLFLLVLIYIFFKKLTFKIQEVNNEK